MFLLYDRNDYAHTGTVWYGTVPYYHLKKKISEFCGKYVQYLTVPYGTVDHTLTLFGKKESNMLQIQNGSAVRKR